MLPGLHLPLGFRGPGYEETALPRMILAGLATNGIVATSDDNGASWTTRYNADGSMRGVAWGRGVAIVVGNAGVVLRSTDGGINWSRSVVGSSSWTWWDVIYGKGRFIILGMNGSTPVAYFSDDGGSSWSALASAPAFTTGPGKGSFANDLFLVANRGAGTTFVSADMGATWTSFTPSHSGGSWTATNSFQFGGGVYGLAGSVGSGNPRATAKSSSPSSGYSAGPTMSSGNVSVAYYLNGEWVLSAGIVGATYLEWSNDGLGSITTGAVFAANRPPTSIAFRNGFWLLATDGNGVRRNPTANVKTGTYSTPSGAPSVVNGIIG